MCKQQLKQKLDDFQKDGLPVPIPKDNLREFFEKTASFWQRYTYDTLLAQGTQETDEKVLRKEGFRFAEARFKQLKPLNEEFLEFEAENEKRKEKDQKKKSKSRS
jgi:hypothetical protein